MQSQSVGQGGAIIAANNTSILTHNSQQTPPPPPLSICFYFSQANARARPKQSASVPKNRTENTTEMGGE